MFNNKFLRKKSIKELKNDLYDLLKKRISLYLQLSSKKLNQTHLIKLCKRNISKIKTIIFEKKKINEK